MILCPTGPNATTIELYRPELSGLTIETVLEPMNTPLIQSVTFLSMKLNPFNNSCVLISAESVIEQKNLLGNNSAMKVETIRFDVDLVYNDTFIVGHLLSREIKPNSQEGDKVYLTIYDECLDLSGEGHEANFVSFVKDFIHMKQIGIALVGKGDVKATTVVGNITVYGVRANNTAYVTGTLHSPSETLPNEEVKPFISPFVTGLDNLPDVQILGIDVPRNGDHGGMVLQLNITISNPSIASFSLGDVNFAMHYR